MATEYEQFIARASVRAAMQGHAFDDSELWPQFVPFFRGPRVRVRTTYDGGETFERTGRIGATTGWRPAFLLIHRSNDHGSGDVLGEHDEIIAVHDGKRYVPKVAK